MKLKMCMKIILYLSCMAYICSGEVNETNSTTEVESFDDSSITSRQSNHIRFEDDYHFNSGDHEPTEFNGREPGHPFKFEDDSAPDYNHNNPSNDEKLTFQDGNRTEQPVRKKRRRRPKSQRPNGQGFPPNPQYQQYNPGFIGPPQGYPNPVGPPQGYPNPVQPYPGYELNAPGPIYRPPRPPPQSFASEALSSVTNALSSIAQYDDYQCVPRLLCEAAGGGSLGSVDLLQSIPGLQSLLTVLSAYSGISTSPLFLFGRAVLLGMTNKGNPALCRSSYPQCPSDPEKLIHYLNNHNGGFFRFFNAPNPQNPQNVQQFYNQLAIPGQQPHLGQPQNNQQYPGQYNLQNYPNYQQNIANPQINQPVPQYPIYNQQNFGQYGLYNPQGNQFYQPNYGLYNPQYQSYHVPNPNIGYPQNFGAQYPYQNKYGFNYQAKNKDWNETEKIQRRIQNNSNYVLIDTNIYNDAIRNKLVFSDKNRLEPVDNLRNSKSLKFPDDGLLFKYDYSKGENTRENFEHKRKEAKALVFPDSPKNELEHVNKYPNNVQDEQLYQSNISHTVLKDYSRDYDYYGNNNFNNNYSNSVNNINNVNEDVRTIYIVRGNGDPNNPEIVKIRPGDNINLYS